MRTVIASKILNGVSCVLKVETSSGVGSAAASDELVQYLEVKQQILLAYCTNMVFYLILKSEGKSVRAHPVMRQLLELRYVVCECPSD